MKRLLSALAITIFLLSCNSISSVLSKKSFTEQFVEVLKNAHPDAKFTITDALVIKSEFDDNELVHYLDNAYNEYRDQLDSLDAIIGMYVTSSSEYYNGMDDLQLDRIVPVIKPVGYLTSNVNHDGTPGDLKSKILYQKYNDELIVAYALDTERNIRYINNDELNDLEVAMDTLLDMAAKNLSMIVPEMQTINNEGVYEIAAGGTYEASLILINKLWAKENFNVDGDIVIAIPNRNILLVGGSNDKKSLERMRSLAKNSFESGNYNISPNLYKWNGKKFELFR